MRKYVKPLYTSRYVHNVNTMKILSICSRDTLKDTWFSINGLFFKIFIRDIVQKYTFLDVLKKIRFRSARTPTSEEGHAQCTPADTWRYNVLFGKCVFDERAVKLNINYYPPTNWVGQNKCLQEFGPRVL